MSAAIEASRFAADRIAALVKQAVADAEAADTYKPRHAWPTECGGERCATRPIAHTPRHRVGDVA